jgi:hypothetical protein
MGRAPLSVPRRLVDVQDPAWLTEAMQHRSPGCRVVGVEVVEDIRVVATKSRLHLNYDPDRPAGMDAVCVKVFADTDDYMAQLSWMSSGEARFYERLADHIPVRVPHTAYAAVDADSGLGVVVMEDLAVRGARFLSSIEPIGVGLVTQTVEQLARLHTMYSAPGALAGVEWLAPVLGPMSERPPIDTTTLQSMLDDERDLGLAREVLDAPRLHRALRTAAALDARLPATVLHGDAHCGNVFVLPDGPGFLD